MQRAKINMPFAFLHFGAYVCSKMHKAITILFFTLFINVISAQRVYYPVESWQYWQAYRNNFTAWKHVRTDGNFNRFARPLYQIVHDTDKVIEIVDEQQSYSKPLFKYFYQMHDAFYKVQEPEQYALIVNPVFHFASGRSDTSMLYRNTRGAEILGNIGGMERGIGFYTYFTENQEQYPIQYRALPDSLNFVPNELFYKPFKKKGAVDYFQARGYVTFSAAKKIVKFQFGHDKNKIGCGYRSLILSDYAPQYLFFKINTDVGKVHYQNLFTQFTDNGPVLSNVLYGKKYAAFHRLSFDLRPNINIGINEMVVFDRIDSTQSNQFDFNYLNPVIFYRSIESNLGSRDNSLMALDFSWRIKYRYVVYGQLLVDEFNLKYIKTEPNWWGNKYGYQLGVRGINAFKIKNLDLLAEYNHVRPYTYSHKRTTQSYSHFNQALAHPLGANFSEAIFEVKYSLGRKWYLQSSLIFARTGRDSFLNGRNYGGNILQSYDRRATEFNSVMYMGKRSDLFLYDLSISYMPRYNWFVDARINYRQFAGNNNLFFSLGLRINADLRKFDY